MQFQFSPSQSVSTLSITFWFLLLTKKKKNWGKNSQSFIILFCISFQFFKLSIFWGQTLLLVQSNDGPEKIYFM